MPWRTERVAQAAAPRTQAISFTDGTALAFADELERELHNLLAAWVPRCVDTQHGGFLTDFDTQWRPTGPHLKGLEFHARMTRTLSLVARAYPHRDDVRRAARHGFAFLRDVMWDAEYGGWFRAVDRRGVPIDAGTKHAHATGYALSACGAYHRLTGDPEALALGRRAFDWLDAYAHDARHGGWFGAMTRDGTVIMRGADTPAGDRVRDVIGTPYGLKDANTMTDVLGGIVDLCRERPDPVVRGRLEEAVACVRDRMVVAPGVIHMYAHPDWTPVPDFTHYGQAFQSANQLWEAALVLDETPDERTVAVGKALADAAFAYGWDRVAGGVHFGGSAFGPVYIGGVCVLVAHKAWWVQAEALRAAAWLWRESSDGAEYGRRLVALWSYVRAHVIDARNGGWLPMGSDSDQASPRAPKASMWRDASHETRALLDCVSLLRAGCDLSHLAGGRTDSSLI